MRRIKLVKGSAVTCQHFILEAFIQDEAKKNTIERKQMKVSKKILRVMADELGLSYDEEQLSFSKQLIDYYLLKSKNS